jgi:signal transduction histidine kinase
VQEALTNVVKHSGSSACTLTVGYRDEEIFIEVTDRGPDRRSGAGGQGHGIIGMRERVSLYGGTLSAAPLSGAGFRVTAVIPAHCQ